ncbi:hypothetical protein HPB51_011994 [Rhipicephalus microplus]|uniref:Uncharacterized protein n=1 Tax=Rhipicephalus microplus TaxID=6941 RepID=A0A9J6F2C9_RHIMP|nr:hypothetical protein HPB51_011994 [Rhipicephalus microplus]
MRDTEETIPDALRKKTVHKRTPRRSLKQPWGRRLQEVRSLTQRPVPLPVPGHRHFGEAAAEAAAAEVFRTADEQHLRSLASEQTLRPTYKQRSFRTPPYRPDAAGMTVLIGQSCGRWVAAEETGIRGVPSKSVRSFLLIGHLRARPKDAEALSGIPSAAIDEDAERFFLLRPLLRSERQVNDTSNVVGCALL